MRVVKGDIKILKAVPFVSKLYSENCNLWFDELYFQANKSIAIRYFVSDLEHLYLPFISKDGLEFYLEFDFADDKFIKCTFSELEECLKDINTAYKSIIDGIIRHHYLFDSDELCLCLRYENEKYWKDCVYLKGYSSKWDKEVAKIKLLGIKGKSLDNDSEFSSDCVRIIKDYKKYIGIVKIKRDSDFINMFELNLSILCREHTLKELVQRSLRNTVSLRFCCFNSDVEMYIDALLKNIYSVNEFIDLGLKVEKLCE